MSELEKVRLHVKKCITRSEAKLKSYAVPADRAEVLQAKMMKWKITSIFYRKEYTRKVDKLMPQISSPYRKRKRAMWSCRERRRNFSSLPDLPQIVRNRHQRIVLRPPARQTRQSTQDTRRSPQYRSPRAGRRTPTR